MEKHILFKKGNRAAVCSNGSLEGIKIVGNKLAFDIARVTGTEKKFVRYASVPSLKSGAVSNAETVIYAGVTGNGDEVLEKLISKASFDVATITGKREVFAVDEISDFAGIEGFEGLEGARRLFVVCGSDLLGAEYGLLYLSEKMGVSPWHYFADVEPSVCEDIVFENGEIPYVSKEPSVELRGFFMNDEWPSLGGWVFNTFGGFNELFYDKVFDLLLRMKGNFLWPAMWSAVFNYDGRETPEASAILADKLGITMGTSHHEPLIRAGEEFSHMMTDNNDVGYGADWSYYKNPRGLYDFWSDSIRDRGQYKNLITVGMRGERDSKILGEDATMKDNIDLLKKTITDQKKILAENGLGDAPKVLALYKEVEDYYYGDATAEGLQTWDGISDCTLLLSDDNFANLRTVPSPELKDREAGWGIYYHFDYHGDPISYEWVNSTPITKAWEQLTSAYEYGIRKVWICNVGDIRPVELPLNYFMDLAYDFETWSKPNKTAEYLNAWVSEQFPEFSSDLASRTAKLINDYTRFNGDRRPEATHPSTFSLTCGNEAVTELRRADELKNFADSLYAEIPSSARDKFYGLAYFPAAASANLRRMMILEGIYESVASYKVTLANDLVREIKSCIDTDIELVRRYNEEMSGGKWKFMMSSKHVNFQHWNDEDSVYPSPCEIAIADNNGTSCGVVSVERGSPCREGVYELPVFDSEHPSSCAEVYVLNQSKTPCEFKVSCSDSRVSVKENKVGSDSTMLSISVPSGDADFGAEVVIDFGSRKVVLKVTYVDLSNSSCKNVLTGKRLDISCDSYIAGTVYCPDGSCGSESDCTCECECASDSELCCSSSFGYLTIDNYGKSSKSVKPYPLCRDYAFDNLSDAPYLEYEIAVNSDGKYLISAVTAPSNNMFKNANLSFALSVDGIAPVKVDTLPEGYMAGYGTDADWSRAVLENCRVTGASFNLSAGVHRVRFTCVDCMIVLQKLVVEKA